MNRVLSLIKGLNNLNIRIIQAAAVIAITITFALFSLFSYSNAVVKNLADNLIRFHVIANSDSPEDQQLKAHVRDRIISYMNVKLKDSRDVEETKHIILENLGRIEEIARNEIRSSGREYPVKAMLGTFNFPTKLYGDITLPAGKYQALRVEIGKAEGANWWCVLFPPLCFVDVTHGTVSADVKEDLKKVLNQEEYKLVTTADEGEIPIKVKFKVVEFFQNSKINVAGAFGNLLKMIRQ